MKCFGYITMDPPDMCSETGVQTIHSPHVDYKRVWWWMDENHLKWYEWHSFPKKKD